MHFLRTSNVLARLVLAWVLLTLGVAFASPMVHPKAMQIVCSAVGGARLVVVGDDGQQAPMGHHTLDCSLCLAANMPPPMVAFVIMSPQPLGHALTPRFSAHIAALVGAPLPPRGPPLPPA